MVSDHIKCVYGPFFISSEGPWARDLGPMGPGPAGPGPTQARGSGCWGVPEEPAGLITVTALENHCKNPLGKPTTPVNILQTEEH